MTPLFEVKNSPGKGQGIFATQNIPAGTTIFQEAPVMIIHKSLPTEADIHQALLQLSEAQQDQFRSLHEGSRAYKTRLARIYFENTFERKGACWICLTGSKINHSCTPNANLVGDKSLDDETLYATQDIEKGQEIFICYRIDICEATSRAQRREYLNSWSFHCSCPACAQVGLAGEMSDARRHLIHALRWKIKFLEPCRADFFSSLDIDVIDQTVGLTADQVEETRKFYDQATTVYNILLAGLLEAEELPQRHVAAAWHEAAESLFDEIQAGEENVILLGAVANIRVWMEKAIDLSVRQDRNVQLQNWEKMRKSTVLGMALIFLDGQHTMFGALRICDLAAMRAKMKLSNERRPADPDLFALRFFTFPDGQPGVRCIEEAECRKFARQQCLRPGVREKAKRDIKLFVKQWKKHHRASGSELSTVAGVKRNAGDHLEGTKRRDE